MPKRKKRKRLDANKRVRIAQRRMVQSAWKLKGGVHDRFRKGYNRAATKRRAEKIMDDE